MNRLLIIDDDPAWRALYRMAFESQFELFEASDPQQALAILHDVRPNVILLDLRMPKMSGLDFIERLDRAGVRVPIVVCSGLVNEANPLRVPGVKVTPKASDLRELSAALREVAPVAQDPHGMTRPSTLEEDTYWKD